MQPIIGAVKIKDGLFVGDEYAAQDLEFVVANKVTHIVNCAGKQVSNHWEPIGVKYLTFNWMDSDSQIILDSADRNFWKFFQFMESAYSDGTSVLIHSVNGVSRAICVVTSYLMKKYAWSLYKTIQFLNSRRNDISLNNGFINQLNNFEGKLIRQGAISRSNEWGEECKNPEEEVLRNTFLNSQIGDYFGMNLAENKEEKSPAISWGDELMKNKSVKAENDEKYIILKSCLKGCEKREIVVMKSEKKMKPKRSASLNIKKPTQKNEDLKSLISQHPTQHKDTHLFREIMQATEVSIKKFFTKSESRKRPSTAPYKKKKPKPQSSSRVLKKAPS